MFLSTAHLFPKLDSLLLDLLRSLTSQEWEAQTVAPSWKVRHVTAHLLDTALRRLSLGRDRFFTEAPAGDLASFINGLNRRGVETYGRLSPAVLISLLEVATRELADHLQSLDPMAAAMFPVSWAGQDESPQWFDTAREYTERWHHQQQIRLAVNRPGIMTRELYHPVLDCFLRGLPHLYRDAAGGDGLAVEVTGDCGGVWRLTDAGPITCRVSIPQEIAWRIFTKGIAREEASQLVTIEGDRELGSRVLSLVAIVG
jgi:uncharacterized protein (TIGR03083 family)